MKNIFESVIARGGYDLGELLKKIDAYHIEGKLSDAEKDALYDRARGQADAFDSINFVNKLLELEDRIRKLEQGGENTQEEYPEYVPGKWYYTGDTITFGGRRYVCAAPEGVVCTWNPDEYPAYWSAE